MKKFIFIGIAAVLVIASAFLFLNKDIRQNIVSMGTGMETEEEQLSDGTIAVAALTERVMEAVRREAAVEEQPTPFRNWIIAGTVLLGGLFGLRFSDVMNWLRNSFGPALDLAVGIILGLFLTAYICMLVASNLRRVRRVFRLR